MEPNKREIEKNGSKSIKCWWYMTQTLIVSGIFYILTIDESILKTRDDYELNKQMGSSYDL